MLYRLTWFTARYNTVRNGFLWKTLQTKNAKEILETLNAQRVPVNKNRKASSHRKVAGSYNHFATLHVVLAAELIFPAKTWQHGVLGIRLHGLELS